MTSPKSDALTPTPATDFDWVIDPKTGGVKIIGVRNKTATRIVVPEEIDGRPVIAFKFDDDYREHSDYLQSLVLNSRCTWKALVAWDGGSIDCWDYWNYRSVLTEIIVPPNHPEFRSVDGVLFSADGKWLYVYPHGKTDEEYVVPDGVERIHDSAFCENRFLKSLTFPASWKGMGDYREGKLQGGPALTEFHVAPGNPKFYTRGNVLFYRTTLSGTVSGKHCTRIRRETKRENMKYLAL